MRHEFAELHFTHLRLASSLCRIALLAGEPVILVLESRSICTISFEIMSLTRGCRKGKMMNELKIASKKEQKQGKLLPITLLERTTYCTEQ